MPLYDYSCTKCGWNGERNVVVAARDQQTCECNNALRRHVSAPLFKFMGVITPGGGPDRFTADCLGIPLKELPDGLRSDAK
jgi:putative FmdB family regulatory protein